MRISDWSSDVCSSDLDRPRRERWMGWKLELVETGPATRACRMKVAWLGEIAAAAGTPRSSAPIRAAALAPLRLCRHAPGEGRVSATCHGALGCGFRRKSSEEHTHEFQSLMRTSHAVFHFEIKHRLV